MATHLAFLHDEPLDEIMAGRKRFEFRLSFGGLACRSAREGDRLLLKRSGGEVEAACDIGDVRFYRRLSPEEVADLAQTYDLGVAKPYFERYTPPNNLDRPVNVGVIELLNVRDSSLPSEVTPRGIMNGWVTNFDAGAVRALFQNRGIRGGVVDHSRSISSGVRPYASLTRSDSRRSNIAASVRPLRTGVAISE